MNASDAPRQRRTSAGPADAAPQAAPCPLLDADRTSRAAAKVGFDWPDWQDVRAKVAEELAELDAAIAEGDRDHQLEELGDLLFSLVNLARHLQLDAHGALVAANSKFQARYDEVARQLAADGLSFTDCDAAALDDRWRAAKRALS